MALTDKDPMPFGKYKDYLMEDVPASYLIWLGDTMRKDKEGLRGNRAQVFQYIEDNWDVLEGEQ